MNEMLEVASKVGVILLLMAVGFVMKRKGVLSLSSVSEITTLLIKVVTPCLIVSAFIQAKGKVTGMEMLYAFLFSCFCLILSIVISLLFFRNKELDERRMLQFSTMFGNVGFMGVPLVQSIVGERGVVFASFGIVAFNVFSWTFGYKFINNKGSIKLKALLLNPGVVGIIAGMPFLALDFKVPSLIIEPVSLLAGLNTPLAMIVVGSYIATVDMRGLFSDLLIYKVALVRLAVIPAISFLLLFPFNLEEDLFLTCIIQASMPVAANAVLFATQFKKNTLLASKAVALTTVLSIVTIPIVTIAAQYAATH